MIKRAGVMEEWKGRRRDERREEEDEVPCDGLASFRALEV